MAQEGSIAIRVQECRTQSGAKSAAHKWPQRAKQMTGSVQTHTPSTKVRARCRPARRLGLGQGSCDTPREHTAAQAKSRQWSSLRRPSESMNLGTGRTCIDAQWRCYFDKAARRTHNLYLQPILWDKSSARRKKKQVRTPVAAGRRQEQQEGKVLVFPNVPKRVSS
mgnify:CR=1 FL=1